MVIGIGIALRPLKGVSRGDILPARDVTTPHPSRRAQRGPLLLISPVRPGMDLALLQHTRAGKPACPYRGRRLAGPHALPMSVQ